MLLISSLELDFQIQLHPRRDILEPIWVVVGGMRVWGVLRGSSSRRRCTQLSLALHEPPVVLALRLSCSELERWLRSCTAVVQLPYWISGLLGVIQPWLIRWHVWAFGYDSGLPLRVLDQAFVERGLFCSIDFGLLNLVNVRGKFVGRRVL